MFLAVTTSLVDGWLYLARPFLAMGVVVFVLVLWFCDRSQARYRRLAAASEPGRQRWTVVVGNRHYPLLTELTIGRLPDCSIVLTDPAVSGLHAAIRPGSEHVNPSLEDLGSRNGTRLRGEFVREPMILVEGDVLSIGDVNLTILRDET